MATYPLSAAAYPRSKGSRSIADTRVLAREVSIRAHELNETAQRSHRMHYIQRRRVRGSLVSSGV